MSATVVLDVLAAACLLGGVALAVVAAIGLVRLPDLFARMHAATKPQTLGVVLVVLGLGLRLRSVGDVGILVLVAAFQLLTAPVAAHMVGRAAYRTRAARLDDLLVDEMGDLDGGPGDRPRRRDPDGRGGPTG